MSLTSHKSLASIEVPGSRPRSDHDAVTIAFDKLLFNKTTASLLSLRGPAQTCTFDLLSHMIFFYLVIIIIIILFPCLFRIRSLVSI